MISSSTTLSLQNIRSVNSHYWSLQCIASYSVHLIELYYKSKNDIRLSLELLNPIGLVQEKGKVFVFY